MAAFDQADINRMEVCFFGKLFLSQMHPLAKATNVRAEFFSNLPNFRHVTVKQETGLIRIA